MRTSSQLAYRGIKNKKIKVVGTVLLDFSETFDIIDHKLLLKKGMCYGFSKSAMSLIQRYLSNISQGFFLFLEASQMSNM